MPSTELSSTPSATRSDAPAGGEADAAEPFEPIELEKPALLTMPGGWKMAQMRAEQPSTGYTEFKKEILNEFARCLNLLARCCDC